MRREGSNLEVRASLVCSVSIFLIVTLILVLLFVLGIASGRLFLVFSLVVSVLSLALGALIGDVLGKRLQCLMTEYNQEVQVHVERIQKLTETKAFLESETLDLKEGKATLLDMMKDVERINLELQQEAAERKRATAQAKQAMENLELILQGGDLGYWDWDLQGDTQTYNQRFTVILGRPDEEGETIGTHWRDLYVHPDDIEQVRNLLSRHFNHETDTYTCEYRVQHGFGHWIWVLERGRVIDRTESESVRMVGTLLDITERKKYELHLQEVNRLLDHRSKELEENQHIIMGMMEDANEARDNLEQANRQLQAAREKAEDATRAKSDFLASMSHEIRTPMNGVIGTASLLYESELTDEQRESVHIIQTSGDALLTLLNDILDFSKIEAGKMKLHQVSFNLREICEQVTELLTSTALEHGIDLVLRFAPGTPTQVIGDAGRIRQVLMNLVGNAVKFTAEGSVCIWVSARNIMDGSAAFSFRVIDTGIGIAKEELPLLFTKFSQADSSASREYAGTGLGLAICKQLIGMMDGAIGVESEEGKGSTFWFRLPLTIDQDAGDLVCQPFFKSESVLIVDDKQMFSSMLKEWMVFWGLEVECVALIGEAVNLIRQKQYELLIIDEQQLPDTDRPFFCEAEVDQLPLMMICPINRRLDSRYKRAGPMRYMIKPIRLENLLRQTKSILGYVDDMDVLQLGKDVAGEDESRLQLSRVLLAEDNLVNQTVARRMLAQEGVEVEVVANGVEALEKWKNDRHFDLIFMDCQMPRMDGFETVRRIRDAEKREGSDEHIPIVALTANAMEGDRERCLEAGMDDYISKPIKQEHLIEILRQYLG